MANAAYVAGSTGTAAYQTLLVRTGSPGAVAASLRGMSGPASGASVSDIHSQLAATLSGLTALDLGGLTTLELSFAVVLAAAAAGLVLALGLAERRRTFAIVTALGARRRQVGAFVWSEAAFVRLGGMALGALAGWGLSHALVKILTGVFDPPPQNLAVPWTYLAGLAVVVGAAWAASRANLAAARRPALELIRDL